MLGKKMVGLRLYHDLNSYLDTKDLSMRRNNQNLKLWMGEKNG